MTLVSLPLLAIVFSVGIASIAVAAGGGGSAGGAGAQNQPASGLPPGEPGPAGTPNNPHRASEDRPADPKGASAGGENRPQR